MRPRATRAPRVAVPAPRRGNPAPWLATRRCLARAGARAIRWRGRAAPEGPIDALVLGGGSHVHPARYGATPLDGPGAYDPDRDAFELRAIDAALRAGLPILGICRGMQLLHVRFGGKLSQRAFEGRRRPRRTLFARRPVTIREGTKLARVVGPEPLAVNTLHSQAIEGVAAPLRITARDRDGIPQALEHPEAPFLLGVQWHPEYLGRRPRHQALFTALVRAAGSRSMAGQAAPPGTWSLPTPSTRRARARRAPRRRARR